MVIQVHKQQCCLLFPQVDPKAFTCIVAHLQEGVTTAINITAQLLCLLAVLMTSNSNIKEWSR